MVSPFPGSFTRLGVARRPTHVPAVRPPLAGIPLLWGGFFLEDRQDQEFEWLSDQTGVPQPEVAEGLTAFDRFFPYGDSWFVTPGNRVLDGSR